MEMPVSPVLTRPTNSSARLGMLPTQGIMVGEAINLGMANSNPEARGAARGSRFHHVQAPAPGFAGLYQVAIQAPGSLGNGNWLSGASIGGVPSPAGVVLTVQQ